MVTFENVSSVGQRPVLSYQVLYAGPYLPPRRNLPAVVAAVPGAAPPSGAPASAAPSSDAGRVVYAANCASCHGAAGAGGVGPSLVQLSKHMSMAQTVAFIENPTGGVMPKLYPATVSAAQVEQVASYITKTFR